MKIVDVKNITQEIDGMFARIRNKIILDEGLPSKDAEKKANDILFKLLEEELYKYTSDLVDGHENETYIVSSSSLDMFAKATHEDLELFEDLWKKN